MTDHVARTFNAIRTILRRAKCISRQREAVPFEFFQLATGAYGERVTVFRNVPRQQSLRVHSIEAYSLLKL